MTDTAPQIAGLEELIRRAPAARDELLALAEGELAKLAGELTEVLER